MCPVQGMSCLTELDLQGNALTRLEDINLLRKHTPRLSLLNLHGTPLADQRGQRLLALRRLPQVGAQLPCLHMGCPPAGPAQATKGRVRQAVCACLHILGLLPQTSVLMLSLLLRDHGV